MIKILAIGNSFSQDATTYLSKIAAAGGKEALVYNCCIGGCSLDYHWDNAMHDYKNYEYQLDGGWSQRMISIREALLEQNWDFITFQQASHDSGLPNTYFPFLSYLVDYVNTFSPSSRKILHQTWAYEIDSDHGCFSRYDSNQFTMYEALNKAYRTAADKMDMMMIPSGDVIQALRETPDFDYRNGQPSLCRDGFHMSETYGRFAVAATWYETLFCGNILDNSFVPAVEGETVQQDKLTVVKRIVHMICETKGRCNP